MRSAARGGLPGMSKLCFDISMSLDGYVAGPDPREEGPLGDGGERLHEWVLGTRAWRAAHGYENGETGPDDEIVAESIGRWGATIMGRGMFGGDGAGGDDPWDGWAGGAPPGTRGGAGGPPFRTPVFVPTGSASEPLPLGETTFTFVTDGIESAL